MTRPRELEFSAKVRDQAIRRANGHCENKACGLPFGNKRPEVDHILPCALGGKPVLANAQVLCAACHKAKTANDVRGIRKADRVRKANNGAKQTARPLKSRGFDRKPKPEKLPMPGPIPIYVERKP